MTEPTPRDPVAPGDPATQPAGAAAPAEVAASAVQTATAAEAPAVDALADPAGTLAAYDVAAAPGTADVEPVEPGAIQPVTTGAAAPGGGRGGSAARIGGYLLAAVLGGALVFGALAAAGRVDLGASTSPTASAAPDASTGGTAASTGTDASTGSAAPGAAPMLGDAAAPVLIEIWADYQCPYCGLLTHAVEPAIVREFVETGKARLTYRDFAFLGEESDQAAGAARCAGQQDAYWRYHDLLFASQQGENQGAFAPKNLVQIAGFAGLDMKAFATCMNDGATVKAAMAETEVGRKLGVESTPTLHVVGPMGSKLVKGLVPMSSVEAAVEYALTGVEPSPTPGPSATASPSASGAAPAASGSAAP